MQPGRELSKVQQDYLVDVIMTWIEKELARAKENCCLLYTSGVELPSEAVELKYTDICQIGEDIRIKCQVCDKKQEESCLQES